MIFEGHVSENGQRNGWGITYHNGGKYIDIGWYKDGKCHGNMVSLNTSDFSINDIFTGWHENHVRKEELKEDVNNKSIEIHRLFQ